MADVYATITDADPALVTQIAEVLEVGCGTGAVTRELAAWPGVAEVTGVDPSPIFLRSARRHARLDNVRFVAGDARSLQFPDRSF